MLKMGIYYLKRSSTIKRPRCLKHHVTYWLDFFTFLSSEMCWVHILFYKKRSKVGTFKGGLFKRLSCKGKPRKS